MILDRDDQPASIRLADRAGGYDEGRHWEDDMAGRKRELNEPHPGDKRFIRRDDDGRISESVDAGRSLARDVRRRAATTVPAGQGDRGDRARRDKSPDRRDG